MEPLVSIIIVNYNGKELLKNCFESLSKILYSNVEIILIDNNSVDDSVNFIRNFSPKTIIIKLDYNKGFAEPNNIGAKIAKGKYLLFLNNDTIVTENFLSELIKEIEKDKKTAICQSLLLKPDGKVDSSGDFIDQLGVVYNSKTHVLENRKISSARGASMLIRKDVFIELDGFDKKFFVSFEDVDLSWRAWILGYSVILVSNSIVYHLGGTTIKRVKENLAFHGFKNQISMKITNFEPKLVIPIVIKFFIIYGFHELKIWLDYIFHGTTTLSSTKYEQNIAQKPSFKIIFSSIFWIFKNFRYLRKKQNLVNSTRKVSTQNLIENDILSGITQ